MSDSLQKGLRLGSPSNPVIMALTEYEGHRLLDIRKYFVEKEKKELKPTRKGVSLNANVVKQVQEVLNEHADSIFTWLADGNGTVLGEVERAMEVRTQAAHEEAVRPRPFQVKQIEWRGAEFFACESSGDEDHVTLNAKHPFIQLLKCSESDDGKNCRPIILLLAAYYRARLRFDGEIEADSNQFFKLLEHEWGLLLKNYCDSQGVAQNG